ncbi:MAG: TIGR02391 family protein [Candidatus Thiodiazotropha sp.]
MLIYVDEILGEIDSIREYAAIIKEKFDQGRTAEELLLDARGLSKRIEYLYSIMPEGCSPGNAGRHVHFMIHYLERDRINSCTQDITDIIEHDLPEGESTVRQWANNLAYVDADLRNELRTLVRTGQFDSAIRKAFVVLKERICTKYDFSNDMDGADLINKLFGSSSEYFSEMHPKEKQAHRDLFAGLFGLVRNRYAHNNVEASLTEMDTVISGINYCLRLIDEFRDEPTNNDTE